MFPGSVVPLALGLYVVAAQHVIALSMMVPGIYSPSTGDL